MSLIKAIRQVRKLSYSAFTAASIEVYDDTMDIQMVIKSKNGRDMTDINAGEKERLLLREIWKILKKELG